MNTRTSPPATYQAEPLREGTEQRHPKWLIAAIMIATAVAFVLIVGRQEISRWHFASAKNAIEDARYADAVVAANKGLKWNPDYAELIAIRATAHFKQDDFEACLVDYDQMIELAAKDGVTNQADIGPKALKANTLQRLDRFEEAILLLSEIVAFREDQFQQREDAESMAELAMALNNRSYIEAQAHVVGVEGIDIAKTLEDIQHAVTLLRNPEDPVVLDTLGYVQLINGLSEEALETLVKAVRLTELGNQRFREQLTNQMQQVVDQRPFYEAFEQLDQQYSIILYHRGEAHDAVGNEKEATADKIRAKELGYSRENGVW